MGDLAFSISQGIPWLGISTTKGSVLYINFELSRFAFQKRLLWIEKTKNTSSRENLEFWNLRGYSADLALLVDKICRRVSKKQYDLIIIDPIYKCLGDRDENSAGQMTDLLNQLEKLSENTKAAVAIAAHFPKGNMGVRESMDRIAGSGVFARDPDAVITMTPHQNPKGDDTVRFDIDFNIRNFAEKDAFVVIWEAPCMKNDVVQPRAKGSAGVKPTYDWSDMLKLKGDLNVKDWQKRCYEETGISRARFYDLKKEASPVVQ
jgi:RecA-family ATPase